MPGAPAEKAGVAGDNRATTQDPSLFAAWADAYLARTRRLGVVDIAQAGDAIAAHAAVIGAESPTILIVGFTELTPQQTRLFTALEGAGASLRHDRQLDARESAQFARATAPTPRDEIAAALSWARAIAIERPAARIGVVVEKSRRAPRRRARAGAGHPRPGVDPARSCTKWRTVRVVSRRAAWRRCRWSAAALDLITLSDAPLTLGAAASLLRSPYLPDADALWQRHAALERRWLEQGVRTVSLTDVIAAVAPYAAELATRWTNGRDALRTARAATPREWADLWRGWLAAAGLARFAGARQRRIPGA